MAQIVILTGAGISAESGINTFRDKGGIWSKVDLNDVATPEGFARNPELVYAFYNMRRGKVAEAEPNPAHFALAKLERERDVLIVTQNVDDLHEKAGSSAVIHMHGSHKTALCAACGHRWDAPMQMSELSACPACTACAVRPDVVWFGETPYQMQEIGAALAKAEVFAAIGTSGQVYPAAAFVQEAKRGGAHCVELNLERTDISGGFDELRHGPAGQVVPDWVGGLL